MGVNLDLESLPMNIVILNLEAKVLLILLAVNSNVCVSLTGTILLITDVAKKPLSLLFSMIFVYNVSNRLPKIPYKLF